MTRLAPFPQTVFWILRRGYQKRNKEQHQQCERRPKEEIPAAIQILDASFHSKSVWGLLASALPSTKHARQILRNPDESQSAQGVRSAGTRIMPGTDSSCIKPPKRTNKSRNNMKPRKETEEAREKKSQKQRHFPRHQATIVPGGRFSIKYGIPSPSTEKVIFCREIFLEYSYCLSQVCSLLICLQHPSTQL